MAQTTDKDWINSPVVKYCMFATGTVYATALLTFTAYFIFPFIEVAISNSDVEVMDLIGGAFLSLAVLIFVFLAATLNLLLGLFPGYLIWVVAGIGAQFLIKSEKGVLALKALIITLYGNATSSYKLGSLFSIDLPKSTEDTDFWLLLTILLFSLVIAQVLVQIIYRIDL